MAPRTNHASRASAVRTTVEDENAGHGEGTDDERDPSNKSENSEGEQEVSAGRTPLHSGWRSPLLGDRVLGQQLLTKPVWYNDARSGATSAVGSQMAASCGVFAVNNFIGAHGRTPRHIDAFRDVAQGDYDAAGNFEF